MAEFRVGQSPLHDDCAAYRSMMTSSIPYILHVFLVVDIPFDPPLFHILFALFLKYKTRRRQRFACVLLLSCMHGVIPSRIPSIVFHFLNAIVVVATNDELSEWIFVFKQNGIFFKLFSVSGLMFIVKWKMAFANVFPRWKSKFFL